MLRTSLWCIARGDARRAHGRRSARAPPVATCGRAIGRAGTAVAGAAAGQPREERVPGDGVARAANAAQRDRGIRRSDARRCLRRVDPAAGRAGRADRGVGHATCAIWSTRSWTSRRSPLAVVELHIEPVDLRPFILDVAADIEPLVNEKGLALITGRRRCTAAPANRSHPPSTDPGQSPGQRDQVHACRRHRLCVRGSSLAATYPRPCTGRASDRPHRGSPMRRCAAAGGDAASRGSRSTWRHRHWDRRATTSAIFDEFEQIDAGPRSDSAHRGTGLGLSISRRLARLSWAATSRSRASSTRGRPSRFGCRSTPWTCSRTADLLYTSRRP